MVGSVGIRPDARLAELAGLAIGPHGGISVDERNRTSDPDIYAVGDAVEKQDWVGGAPTLIALANVANRQGRRVADDIGGLMPSPDPLARHRDRQGLRADGGGDRVERETAPGPRDDRTGRCTRTRCTTPATTRGPSRWP